MAKGSTCTIKVKSNIPKIINKFSGAQLTKLKHAIGARFEGALVSRIQEGDVDWAPLSEAWAEFKGHGRQWYYTGGLEAAIRYEIKGNTIYIGILGDGEIAGIATKLEYGSGNIPARPLFVPVTEDNSKDIINDSVKWIENQIKACKI